MQEMAHNYETESAENKKLLEEKCQEITHLKDQNIYLRQERDNQENKVESLAQKYVVEIERLNNQLKELKEEVNYQEEEEEEQEADGNQEGDNA